MIMWRGSQKEGAYHLPHTSRALLTSRYNRYTHVTPSSRALAPRPLHAQMQAAIEALDGLGTWDRLTLNGGRVINGDARGFSCGGKPHVVYELPRLRQVVSEIVFEHRRSITVGSLLAVLGHEPATTLRPTLRSGADRSALPPPAPIPIQVERITCDYTTPIAF